jgi:hypothetical protein
MADQSRSPCAAFFTENNYPCDIYFSSTSLANSVVQLFCPSHLFLITPRTNNCKMVLQYRVLGNEYTGQFWSALQDGLLKDDTIVNLLTFCKIALKGLSHEITLCFFLVFLSLISSSLEVSQNGCHLVCQ